MYPFIDVLYMYPFIDAVYVYPFIDTIYVYPFIDTIYVYPFIEELTKIVSILYQNKPSLPYLIISLYRRIIPKYRFYISNLLIILYHII